MEDIISPIYKDQALGTSFTQCDEANTEFTSEFVIDTQRESQRTLSDCEIMGVNKVVISGNLHA